MSTKSFRETQALARTSHIPEIYGFPRGNCDILLEYVGVSYRVLYHRLNFSIEHLKVNCLR